MNRPTRSEAAFNRLFGWLVGMGLAPGGFFLLRVRGRRSGQVRSTPVDVLHLRGRMFLVAPRGETQWVLNARAAGVVALARGRRTTVFAVRELADEEKPDVLKAYLDRFRRQVQRFFPVPAGAPRDAFVPLAGRYPVLELIPTS